jgi:lipopolysaccharide/colanic/teichoic acid biosynthesis glycosyltransferase
MYNFIKRIFDFTVSLILLIILLPLFIVIIIMIRTQAKGSAIFSQQRAGKNGQPFTFYKFRTMKPDSDPFGPSPKSGEDPRLTRIGKFLREYSLDELPQLLNVLKGQMSLVGPRPLYISQIPEWNQRQAKRLRVLPGITGLAQVNGRGDLTIEEKLDLDVKYVENAGFIQDMKILIDTAAIVITKKSIYEKRYSKQQQTRNSEQ